MFKPFLIALAILCCITSLIAKKTTVSPLQISIIPPFQAPDEKSTIAGLRLNLICGQSENMYGIDLGLVNITKESSVGIATGFANASQKHLSFQIGVMNFTEKYYGLQFGLVNGGETPFGWQAGFVNITGKSYLPMAGIFANWVMDTAYLGQISLGFNQARNKALFQLSGVLNNTNHSLLQLAAGPNFSDKAVLQFSAGYNWAINGCIMVSPGINRAKKNCTIQTGFLLNTAEHSFLQTGLLNNTKKSAFQLGFIGNKCDDYALQMSGFGNLGKTGVFQFSPALNYSGESEVQIAALVNMNRLSNFQLSLVNLSRTSGIQLGGFNQSNNSNICQAGLFNRSKKVRGLMIGLINDLYYLDGVQLGLINIARHNALPVSFLFNVGYGNERKEPFTGFLTRLKTPMQASIFSPLQIFTSETSVHGLRLNILYSENRDVYGIDFGIAGYSRKSSGLLLNAFSVVEDDAGGIQAGAYNEIRGDFYGVQVSCTASRIRKSLYGFSLAPFCITSGDVNGMQLGLLTNIGQNVMAPQLSAGPNIAHTVPGQLSVTANVAKEKVNGPQFSGAVNWSTGDVWGQAGGLFNYSKGKVRPFQISCVYNTAGYCPLQIAGFGNHASAEALFQFAGVFNMVTEQIRAAPFTPGKDPIIQISSLYNLSENTWLQFSAFNLEHGTNSIQLGGINVNTSRGHIQTGGVNFARELAGIQLGLINGSVDFSGIQLGGINLNVVSSSKGLKLGAWNLENDAKGLTVGILNVASDLDGMQIGVLNINLNGPLPIMIGFNYGG